MKKYKNLQKILCIVLSLVLVLTPISPVFAEGEPPLEALPTLQQMPPAAPAVPQAPDPAAVAEPQAPQAPQESPLQTVAPLQSLNNPQSAIGTPPTGEQEVTGASSSNGSSSNGNNGDTTLTTGDASNTTTLSNSGNVNQSGGASGCCAGSATVLNDGNGAHSSNNASATTTNNNDTNQNNSAEVLNDVDSATVTGQNSTSFNTGNSTIDTGNANTTATLYNDINSNLAGVSVAEFNIANDLNGDYVLDFGANCILGCNGAGMDVANSNNGAGSENNASASTTNNNNTDQTNDGVLTNNLDLTSDSGNNYASFNNGGDSAITTGDANVSANVVNFMNNNLAGNVVLGVVNIFGDLVGDILLPDGFINECANCGAGTNVANSGNGAHSDNTASSETTNNNDIFQNNDATIENNLVLNANSGDNKTSFNTGGDSSVTTGDTKVDANLLNVANMNIAGGDWLLVIVNRGGQWIGQILGAPEGSDFAGTSGTEFVVDENGQIIASNTGNGAGSENNASTQTTNNNSVNQDNNAHVVNNLNLTANTGNNSSSYNTGGDSTITTGDAKVIANLVNFVNNNITGGKLVVAVVNVFGSWTGDFVMPGQEQRAKTTSSHQTAQNTGGPAQNVVSSTSSSNSTSQTSEDDDEAEEASAKSPAADYVATVRSNYQSALGLGSENEESEEVAVLGQSITQAETLNNAIKINLAWLVVLVPALALFLGAGYIVRRKVLLRNA